MTHTHAQAIALRTEDDLQSELHSDCPLLIRTLMEQLKVSEPIARRIAEQERPTEDTLKRLLTLYDASDTPYIPPSFDLPF
ncbi:MAG: hypothetical protein CMI01_06290 [Oceanospirillaceae bacterium]|uniref:hypothetical protein n=1 Tax=Marinobacterium litorale TaxID=404770 RepID=UPI000428F183|nr:hypothetical protein [Marinobacterium litorale]MBS98268.1 hypothetical protein [Oceanospirillaceae bacterium]